MDLVRSSETCFRDFGETNILDFSFTDGGRRVSEGRLVDGKVFTPTS